MASLFEQASLAKRASDDQLVNILSNRMPSVDISQAVAMAELTSRKNMRNAAANQEMIQQGIGAVPVKDQVIAETVQSQNPQMVNPNLVAMSSPEMGNVPRSEAMDMSAPGSIPGAAAGGIVSSYKEPEGRETRGIPAAVRMFEGGRVAFQSGPGPNTVGTYASIVNRIKELDNEIKDLSQPLMGEFGLGGQDKKLRSAMNEKAALEAQIQTTKDAYYDENMTAETAQSTADETPEYVFTGPNATNKFLESLPQVEENITDARLKKPQNLFMESELSQESMVKPEETQVTPLEENKEAKKTGEGEIIPPASAETKDIVSPALRDLMDDRDKAVTSLENKTTETLDMLKKSKTDVQSFVDNFGKKSQEEIAKLEEFDKPFKEYLATIKEKVGKRKGEELSRAAIDGGIALATSKSPLLTSFAEALGVSVAAIDKNRKEIDDLENTAAQLQISRNQQKEAQLIGDIRARDNARFEGAKLQSTIDNQIATVGLNSAQAVANMKQKDIEFLANYTTTIAKLDQDLKNAQAARNFELYKLNYERIATVADNMFKEKGKNARIKYNALSTLFTSPLATAEFIASNPILQDLQKEFEEAERALGSNTAGYASQFRITQTDD
jgi:hypothetical protein